jgi:hypothetical protein
MPRSTWAISGRWVTSGRSGQVGGVLMTAVSPSTWSRAVWIAARLDGHHHNTPVPHTIHYSVGDNWVDLTLDNGARSSLWWATKNEWLGLLDVAGLQLESLHGGFAGEPFTDDSHEYVFVAQR